MESFSFFIAFLLLYIKSGVVIASGQRSRYISQYGCDYDGANCTHPGTNYELTCMNGTLSSASSEYLQCCTNNTNSTNLTEFSLYTSSLMPWDVPTTQPTCRTIEFAISQSIQNNDTLHIGSGWFDYTQQIQLNKLYFTLNGESTNSTIIQINNSANGVIRDYYFSAINESSFTIQDLTLTFGNTSYWRNRTRALFEIRGYSSLILKNVRIYGVLNVDYLFVISNGSSLILENVEVVNTVVEKSFFSSNGSSLVSLATTNITNNTIGTNMFDIVDTNLILSTSLIGSNKVGREIIKSSLISDVRIDLSNSIAIYNSEFVQNNMAMGTSEILLRSNDTLSIVSSQFIGGDNSNHINSTECGLVKGVQINGLVANSTITHYFGNGASVMCVFSGSNMSVINSTFSNNKGLHNGVIYSENSYLHVEDCEFSKNNASIGSCISMNISQLESSKSFGSASLVLLNCLFEDNVATGSGSVLNVVSDALQGEWWSMSQARDDIIIKDCIFNQNMADHDGCIFSEEASLQINNTDFTNNYADKFGAAIVATSDVCFDFNTMSTEYPHLMLFNTSFRNNSGEMNTGAIGTNCYQLEVIECIFDNNNGNLRGGGILSHHSCTTITNSQFSNNLAQLGSAIALSSLLGTLDNNCINTIKNTTFHSNIAGITGAGVHIATRLFNPQSQHYYTHNTNKTSENFNHNDWIYTDKYNQIDNYGSIKIDLCSFMFNNASIFGAAISLSPHWMYNPGFNDILMNSLLSSNINTYLNTMLLHQINLDVNGCEFESNIISNNNNTVNFSGGAALGWLLESGSQSHVKLTMSTFSNNVVTVHEAGGGAVSITCQNCINTEYIDGSLELDGNSFINNTAAKGGAAFISARFHPSIAVTNNIYANNTAILGHGGAMLVERSSLIIENTVFIGNSAQSNGGALITTTDCDTDINVPELSLGNAQFSFNYAYVGGSIGTNCYHVPVKGSDFSRNFATTRGGAITSHHSCTHLESCIFDENEGEIGGAIAFSSLVASVNDYDCVHTIDGTKFSKNKAGYSGGAIHITNRLVNVDQTSTGADDWMYTPKNITESDSSAFRHLNINNVTFDKNKALQFGASIGISRHWIVSNEVEERFFNVTKDIPGNMIEIRNSIFKSNNITTNAEKDKDEQHGGAGIGWLIEENDSSMVDILESQFFDNVAVSQGGAIFATCYNCKSENDALIHDLGKCECYKETHDTAKININYSQFSNNTALTLGGGLSIVCGESRIDNSQFDGNIAQEYYANGGAMAIRYKTWLYNNTIKNNDAHWYGGGGYFGCAKMDNAINVTKTNYESNVARIGGAIYYEHCDNVGFYDSRYSSNTARYGGAAIGSLLSDFPEKSETHWKSLEFEDNMAPIGSAVYVNSYEHIELVLTNISSRIDETITTVNVPFEVKYDDSWGRNGLIEKYYLHFHWDKEFEFDDIFSWGLHDIKIYNERNQPAAIIDKKLQYPSFVILDANGTYRATVGDELTVSINVEPIFQQFNCSFELECKNNNMNFTFDLYGVISTIDNSSHGTEYKIYGNDLIVHDNVGYALGAVVIDDTIGGIYFYVDNSSFYNNSALVGAAINLWHCGTCEGFKNKFGYLSNVRFENNYAENAGGAMTAHYFTINSTNIIFNNQVTDGFGGNIYAYDGKLSFENSVFTNTTTLLSAGVWLEHAYGFFTNCDFRNNVAQYGKGSCLYISDISELTILNDEVIEDNVVIRIDGCLFEDNIARWDGGAMYVNTDYEESDLQYLFDETTSAPTSKPSQAPTNLPTATTTQPTMIPTRLPSKLLTAQPTNAPTAKTHCVNLSINIDVHDEDITWSLESGPGFGNFSGETYGGSYQDFVNVTRETGCIEISDKCFRFKIQDNFGDGLNYGQGNWNIEFIDHLAIGYQENYSVSSYTGGYFAYNETASACLPSTWQNENISIVTAILSVNDDINATSSMVNALMDDLSYILDNRLSIDLIFSDIVSIETIVGHPVTIRTTSDPTAMPTMSPTGNLTKEENMTVYEMMESLCIRRGRYCCDESKNGKYCVINILAALCQWYYYDDIVSNNNNTFESWDYYYNDSVKLYNESMKVINNCPFVTGDLDDNQDIAILEMSLAITNTSFTPTVQILNDLTYEVTNVSDVNWKNLWSDTTVESEYGCEIYERNDILAFICQVFDDKVVAPFVCQARGCLDDWDCGEDDVLLMWSKNGGDTEEYITSDSFYLGTQYYGDFAIESMSVTIIGEYPFSYKPGKCINSTTYNYIEQANKLFDSVALVVTSKFCHDVSLILKLQELGARGVILAQDVQNYTTDATTTEPPDDDEVAYIVANCTLCGIRIARFEGNENVNLTNAIIGAFDELIGLTSYISHYSTDDSNNTINFELKSEIRGSANEYTHLENKAYISMINQSMQYYIAGEADGEFLIDAISINDIRIESIIPSESPTVAPTQIPTVDRNKTDIFIPVRIINDESAFDFVHAVAIANGYKQKSGQRHLKMTARFGCETKVPTLAPTDIPKSDNYSTTTSAPTQLPTVEPTLAKTIQEVAVYFYNTDIETIDATFLLNYYDYHDDTIFDLYSVCGLESPLQSDVLYAAVDTLYTIPDKMCVFFGGSVLTIVNEEDKYDADTETYAFKLSNHYDNCTYYSSLDTNDENVYFDLNDGIDLGTYCITIRKVSKKFYDVQIKNIYHWLEPAIIVANSEFNNNHVSNDSDLSANGGAVEIVSTRPDMVAPVGDYHSISIVNCLFDANTAIGGRGGAISGYYSQDSRYNWRSVLEIKNSIIKNNYAYDGGLVVYIQCIKLLHSKHRQVLHANFLS